MTVEPSLFPAFSQPFPADKAVGLDSELGKHAGPLCVSSVLSGSYLKVKRHPLIAVPGHSAPRSPTRRGERGVDCGHRESTEEMGFRCFGGGSISLGVTDAGRLLPLLWKQALVL